MAISLYVRAICDFNSMEFGVYNDLFCYCEVDSYRFSLAIYKHYNAFLYYYLVRWRNALKINKFMW